MANIHQKTQNGVWYISYRQGGILKHRSLGTKSGTEARRLKRGIELKVEANPNVEVFVSKRPKTEPNADPTWMGFTSLRQVSFFG